MEKSVSVYRFLLLFILTLRFDWASKVFCSRILGLSEFFLSFSRISFRFRRFKMFRIDLVVETINQNDLRQSGKPASDGWVGKIKSRRNKWRKEMRGNWKKLNNERKISPFLRFKRNAVKDPMVLVCKRVVLLVAIVDTKQNYIWKSENG